MNKIIKGKTHYYENDTLTTGTFKIGETGTFKIGETTTFPNDITTAHSPSRVYDTEEIENIINENNKLKQQLQTYKDKINKATKHIKENSDYEEVGDDYISTCEKNI